VHGGRLDWAPGVVGSMGGVGVACFFTVRTAVHGIRAVSSTSGRAFYAGGIISGVGTCTHGAHRDVGRVAGGMMMAEFEALVALITRVGGVEFRHSSMFV
jgi:hypothetical protein